MTVTERIGWKDGVSYQIYPASYKDSNGDGLGDIPGIIFKIDYIKDLGIHIAWLSPMYASLSFPPFCKPPLTVSSQVRNPSTRHGLRHPRLRIRLRTLRHSFRYREPHLCLPLAGHASNPRSRREPHLRRTRLVPRIEVLENESQARLVHMATRKILCRWNTHVAKQLTLLLQRKCVVMG